jgi:hypothetical protein
VRRGRLNPAVAIFAVGIVLFVIAAVGGGDVMFGIADICIGVAIGLFAWQGAPPAARSPNVYGLGLVIAAVGAILDGVLTLAGQNDIAGSVTWLVVAGAVVAAFGHSAPSASGR